MNPLRAVRAAQQRGYHHRRKKTITQVSASPSRLFAGLCSANNPSGVLQSPPESWVCVPRGNGFQFGTHTHTHTSPWLLSLDGFSLQLPAGSEADRAGRLQHTAAGARQGEEREGSSAYTTSIQLVDTSGLTLPTLKTFFFLNCVCPW